MIIDSIPHSFIFLRNTFNSYIGSPFFALPISIFSLFPSHYPFCIHWRSFQVYSLQYLIFCFCCLSLWSILNFPVVIFHYFYFIGCSLLKDFCSSFTDFRFSVMLLKTPVFWKFLQETEITNFQGYRVLILHGGVLSLVLQFPVISLNKST